MPGVLHHLFFAEEVVKNVASYEPPIQPARDGRAKLERDTFYLASLLPDLAKNKNSRHFREDSRMAPGFRVPDLKKARRSLVRVDEPSVRLGILAHLFLDKCFIEYFVYPQFDFNWEEYKIVSHRTRREYSISEFFSGDGLYHGYSELNRVILDRHLVDMDFVNSLPDWPPLTGIQKYDIWREESWHSELNRYLAHTAESKDTLFLADEFVSFIIAVAQGFCATNVYRYFR